MKCEIEEKEKMIKTLLRDNNEIKTAMENLRSTIASTSSTNTGGTVTVN